MSILFWRRNQHLLSPFRTPGTLLGSWYFLSHFNHERNYFQFLPHLVFCNFYSCLYPWNDPNYMNGCEVWGWSSVFLYIEYTKRKWLFIIFVMNMPYISRYRNTKCFWNTGNIVFLVVWKMVLPVVMTIRGLMTIRGQE